MKKIAIIVLALAVTTTSTLTSSAAENNPYGTSTVDPAGVNEVIFTISKGSKKSMFAYSRLLKMKSTTISIYEPFLKKRQTFTVIPMKNFFPLVGISGKDRVATVALNDYFYSNTASEFISAGAFIAIKRNGVEIPYDQGGPIRLIFSDKSKWAKNLDAWNWSLVAMRVK
jgi:hypothetical protein